jgi:hypothetical protein
MKPSVADRAYGQRFEYTNPQLMGHIAMIVGTGEDHFTVRRLMSEDIFAKP